MLNNSETYKSPYSLLNLKPGQSTLMSWAELVRRRRKEILAEFDLHLSPSLVIDGQEWTRSEILAGFEKLSNGVESYHQTIWELGWADFWAGKEGIPMNMSLEQSWLGPHQQHLWDDFEKVLSKRISFHLHARQFSPIFELLSFSFAISSSILQKAEAPVSNLLVQQTLEWRRRMSRINPEDTEEEYREWYPAMYTELFCQLPKRYEEASRQWAEAVIDTSVLLARYLTFEQRNETLIPTSRASKYWPEDLRRKWNRFQQYLSIVPMADNVDQKRIIYTRKILQILVISLAFGVAGFFLGETSAPPMDYRNLPTQYTPLDSSFNSIFEFDTFQLKPYRPNNIPEQIQKTSPDSTSQSTP